MSEPRERVKGVGPEGLRPTALMADLVIVPARLIEELERENERLREEVAKWRDIGGPKRTALVRALTTQEPSAPSTGDEG